MIDIVVLALALAAQAPEPVPISPSQFAQAIQGVVGQTYEGGVTITRIYAEDPVIIIVLDGPAGWRTSSAGEVSDIFLNSFCEGRDFEYFVNGNAMRIDTTEAGVAARPGPIIRACPPPAPDARPK